MSATAAQVANDLAAQARFLRRRGSMAEEAEVFEHAAAAIRDLTRTGRTRRDVSGIYLKLRGIALAMGGAGGHWAQAARSAERGMRVMQELKRGGGAAC